MSVPIEASGMEHLLSALEETTKKVALSLLPSIESHVQNEKFDARDGLDFLDTKNSLLLSYLIDLAQYIKLNLSKDKDESKLVSCMGRLREMKIVLEKIRPLEKKMRYQIDKLLALAASSSEFAAGSLNETAVDDNADASEKNTDPLAFRPNPEFLLEKDDDDENEESDHDGISTAHDDSDSTSSDSERDDDDELAAARAALNIGRSKDKANSDGRDDDKDAVSSQGVYRAPRLAAVPFVEKEKQAEKEARILKRQADRMRKSEFLSALKSTFGDAPEEDDLDGGAVLGKQRERARRFDEHLREKTKYEEDAMVRLTTSRKEKKLRNKILRDEVSNLNQIADLGNIAAGVTAAFGSEGKKDKRKNDIMEKSPSNRHANGKRRRDAEDYGNLSSSKKDGSKRVKAKNSFQKELFGMGGSNKRKGGKR